MNYLIGLGNPGEEYKDTRHNTGRMALESFVKKIDSDGFAFHKKSNAEVAVGTLGKEKVTLVLPDTFMNKSGASVAAFVKPLAKGAKKGLENVVVVYDDLDLPLGVIKVSYNKGTGGHRGLESVAKVLKTKQFVRVRVGISPATAKGAAKKPMGEEKVLDFILGKFKQSEKDELKKIFKTVNEALECIVTNGYIAAMNGFN